MSDVQSITPRARIYTKKWCGYCFAAKRLLRRAGVAFLEVPVDRDPELRWRVSAENGGWPTVPMIVVDGRFIGGHAELRAMHRRGRLVSNASPAAGASP